MNTCSEFCQGLASLSTPDGSLPTHADLVAQLNFDQEAKEVGRSLGTWEEITARKTCTFCELVVNAVWNSAEAEIDQGQRINVLLFPEETSFRLSYPSPLGTRLSFTAEYIENVVAPDSARPISNNGVKPEQMLHWLKKCDEDHEDCYLNTTDEPNWLSSDPVDRNPQYWSLRERHTSNFRVLDVVDGCLKKVPLHSPYVTLSYVWGQLAMFKLLRCNVGELFIPGALDNIYSLLPKTITDAINLVRSLGLRNLWVDSLCLIQDSVSDIFIGIELMNSIYSGSYFTIIASSGADAAAGLPGITSSPRPVPQTIVQLRPGLNMTVTQSIDRELARSVYNQRGWTLQELVLSRRAIIFTDSQIHFRCQDANWSEGSWSDKWSHWVDADDGNISRIPGPYDGWLPSFWAYQKLCEDYSRRRLLHGGDALRAIAGVSRPLFAGMRTLAVEGLPGYYLDHFLLFVSLHGEARRRPAFGSFSWAGWEGRVMWPRETYLVSEYGHTATQDLGNILRFFQRDRLCEWRVINLNAHHEQLSTFKYGEPAPLQKLMEEFPDLLEDCEVEAEQNPTVDPLFCSGGVHGDMPMWETRTLVTADYPGNEDERWNQKALDMANSRVEFQRLTRRMANQMVILTMSNWWASAQLSDRPGPDPVSMAGKWERAQFKVRELGSVGFGNDGPHDSNDKRSEEVKAMARYFTLGRLEEDVSGASEESQSVHDPAQTRATSIPEIP
ncbi:uncharacterized protein DNG_06880 [Cephalotrichum gorgonifer]|uniref:Heterokaryon incompatibility domain-containing protein n=1 Tax=Cephalotrichum gorgonifer TaxID=2041049 RepID=A0AAE8N3K6_9PEZI|nr:uncharacterized protein DNG_06880 [Cephalotrichum gorgonifer]